MDEAAEALQIELLEELVDRLEYTETSEDRDEVIRAVDKYMTKQTLDILSEQNSHVFESLFPYIGELSNTRLKETLETLRDLCDDPEQTDEFDEDDGDLYL